MAPRIDVNKLWQQVRDGVRRGPINRSLWEAVDAAVPLVIEDELLVVGFEPKDMRHASYVQTTVNKIRIQEVIQAKSGTRFDIRCIEGATIEAWEGVKVREAQRGAQAEEAFKDFREHGATLQKWQDLINSMQTLFAETENRRLSVVQAQMLIRALPKVYEVDSQLRIDDPSAGHIHDQQLNRVIERVSTITDLSATQVALEYLRYKGSRKKS